MQWAQSLAHETAMNLPDIEQVRTYWNRRPCNLRHSAKPVGSREYFDDVEHRKYFVEPHIPPFADFPAWSGKRVLEIGCGIGTDAVSFARAGADYTGIELSEISLDLARKRFGVYGLAGQLMHGDGELAPENLAPASFDLVYSFGVIHHTPDPRAVIENARRLIKPDGVLKIMLYASNSWKAIMIAEGFDQPEAQAGCPIARTYTPEDVRALLAGRFAVTALEQAHIFPYVVEKYVCYEYERQPWFAAMPDHLFAALERKLGWHMLITATPI